MAAVSVRPLLQRDTGNCMSRYRLIFEGRISPQADRIAVQRRLADLFQVSEDEIASLFTRVPVVLKEDLAYDTALKDKADFLVANVGQLSVAQLAHVLAAFSILTGSFSAFARARRQTA